MRRQGPPLLLSCLALAGVTRIGAGQLDSVLVATVDEPVFVTHAPGDFDRLFVLGRHGRIFVVSDGQLLDDPFLDLTGLVQSGENEQGLLGLAFHPEYQANGLFYVNYTRDDDPATVENETVIARYEVTADPDVADPGSAQTVMIVAQPRRNHNGGWLGFGPDGYLYLAFGDGGGGYDPCDNAQDLDSLLGKLLRVDVDCDGFPNDPQRNYGIPPDNPFVGRAGADEIWVYGLRNPWRCSFDPAGNLYIGDVGQALWEELNFQPAGSPGGENYGWDCKEGTFNCTGQPTCVCNDPTLVDPIFEFTQLADPAVIIGGYVYRGCGIPDLSGSYIFADRFGPIWRLVYDGTQIVELEEIQDQVDPPGFTLPSSFGEDAFGEIYFCDSVPGDVHRIVSTAPVDPDCNGNGSADACDIVGGFSPDDNGNGVPDECECPWDCADGDGMIGIEEFLAVLGTWGQSGAPCDFDGGGVGITDFLKVLGVWGPCP